MLCSRSDRERGPSPGLASGSDRGGGRLTRTGTTGRLIGSCVLRFSRAVTTPWISSRTARPTKTTDSSYARPYESVDVRPRRGRPEPIRTVYPPREWSGICTPNGIRLGSKGVLSVSPCRACRDRTSPLCEAFRAIDGPARGTTRSRHRTDRPSRGARTRSARDATGDGRRDRRRQMVRPIEASSSGPTPRSRRLSTALTAIASHWIAATAPTELKSAFSVLPMGGLVAYSR